MKKQEVWAGTYHRARCTAPPPLARSCSWSGDPSLCHQQAPRVRYHGPAHAHSRHPTTGASQAAAPTRCPHPLPPTARRRRERGSAWAPHLSRPRQCARSCPGWRRRRSRRSGRAARTTPAQHPQQQQQQQQSAGRAGGGAAWWAGTGWKQPWWAPVPAGHTEGTRGAEQRRHGGYADVQPGGQALGLRATARTTAAAPDAAAHQGGTHCKAAARTSQPHSEKYTGVPVAFMASRNCTTGSTAQGNNTTHMPHSLHITCTNSETAHTLCQTYTHSVAGNATWQQGSQGLRRTRGAPPPGHSGAGRGGVAA